MMPLLLMRSTRRVLVRAFLAALAASIAGLLLLALSGWFLTAAALAGLTGTAAAFNYLLPSAAIRGLAILRTVGRYGERLWSHQAALTMMADQRGTLFARLAQADTRTSPDLSSGEASTRLITDIAALEDLVVRRPALPAGILTALLGIALASLAGITAALAAAAVLGAAMIVIRRAGPGLTEAPSRALAAEVETLRRAILDHAAARPEIIAYGLTDRIAELVEAQAGKVDAIRLRLVVAEALLAGLPVLATGIIAALVVLLGLGSAPVIATALLAATAAVETLGVLVRTATRNAAIDASLARLDTLITLPPAPPAPADSDRAVAINLGQIAIEPGERLAITGPSGSGKTRLLESLAGMRLPVHSVALNGIPLDGLTASQIAAQFALAPQDPMLIVGSIADNLRIARPGIDAQAMAQALAMVGLADRVARMPAGVDTLLGESGGFLSGGERKRLSLARALLANRPWLVLDEPTEGLDADTERQVIAGIDDWLRQSGAGLILVSHRPAPLVLADRRVAIDDIALLAQEGSGVTLP